MKLTKSHRKQIEDLVLAHKFSKLIKELEDERMEIGEKLYTMQYTAKEFKLMASLPKGWLPETGSFVCRTLSHGWLSFPLKETKRASHHRSTHTAVFQQGDPENELVNNFLCKKGKVMDKRKELRVKIKALLDSVNTVKQAIDVWPEAEAFILKATNSIPNNLPTVIITDLNKELSLPPE